MPLNDLSYFEATGVENPLYIRYQDVGGFLPGSITFTMAPQRRWNCPVIDIQLFFNSFRYKLINCQVRNITEIPGGDGRVWQVTAVDRRWLWEEQTISGIYNRYLETGALWKKTEKRPRELLTLLLKALGEKNFDVSKVDDKIRPEVHWCNSKVYLEADALCSRLGCRLIHNLNDTYSVVPVGVGDPVKIKDGIKTYTQGITLPVGPDSFEATFKPRYEVDIRLKAVGIEEDGTLKPIDELSYAPDNGWNGEYPGEFSGVMDKMNDRFYQELARRSVWKYFQITTTDKGGGPMKVPGYKGKAPTTLEEILPVYAESLAAHADLPATDFYNFRTQPYVWGYHVNGSVKGMIAYDTDANHYNLKAWRDDPFGVNDSVIEMIDFSLDCERGLFMFSEPIYAFDLDDPEEGYRTPELTARVCITLRDPKTLGEIWHKVKRKRKVPQRGTGSRIIQIDEVTADFWFESGGSSKVGSNADLVKKEADHYMDQAEKDYQYENPHTVTFNDWRAFPMSGAIVEVTWERTAAGCTTTVSYNDRHNFARPSYEETRLLALQREAKERNQTNIKRVDMRGIIQNWQRQRIIQEGF